MYVNFHLDHSGQSSALNLLASCTVDIADWFIANRVKINMGKSLLLYTTPKRKLSKLAKNPLVVGDADISPSAQARNFGVTFDSELSMVPPVPAICKSTLFHLSLIGRIRKYLDVKSTKSLVHASFVLRSIDYANSLLFDLPKTLLGKLQRFQKSGS